jgi:hypothetical protein
VVHILSIPLREDFIAWHIISKGVFSVKSAYKVSVDSASTEHGPSSGGTVHCPTIHSAFP